MIGYLVRRLSDVPDGDEWLTAAERRWFTERRSAKRIADWRLGRWTAKAAATAFLELQASPPGGAIEILAGEDGAPEPRACGRALPLSISLSHSHGRGLSVVSAAGVELGCDLERVEPRSPAFIDSYLTPAERAVLEAAGGDERELLVTLFWSAKESALKALRRGLRADTRTVEVAVTSPTPGGWGRLEVDPGEDDLLTGCWALFEGLAATIVSRPPADRLVDLDDASRAR